MRKKEEGGTAPDVFWKRNYTVILFYLGLALLIFYPMLMGKLIAPGDARSYYFPFKVYYSSLPSHGLPIWMPYQFAGISYLGSSESGALYPPNFFFLASGSAYLYNLLLLLHYLGAALFTFLYLRLICDRKLPAVLGGAAFGLAGFVMAHKGHLNIVNAAVWLPLMLYLYERIRREMRVSLGLWAALAVAVQVFAGHYQISLYSYIVLALFIIYYGALAEKGTRRRFLALTVLPLVLGVFLALPQLLATWEVSRVATGTGNGYTFFTGYSFSPWLFLQFVFPFFFTSDYGVGFWGPGNLSEASGFVGTGMLILAAVALLRYRKRDPQVRFWFWAGLLAVFLMLGSYNPLYRLTYYIPLYNLFRIPSRHLLELDLALAVLGSLGLSYVLGEKEENRRRLLAGTGALLALGIFMAVLAGPIYRFLVSSRGNAFRQGLENALRWDNPAILVPLACAAGYLLVWFLWYRGRRFSHWAGAALVAVVVLELFSFSAFIDRENFSIAELRQEASASWRGALADTAPETRVLYTGTYPYNMDPVNQEIAMLNGYESLIIDDFSYLTGLSLSQNEASWRNLVTDNVTLSAANCGYVVVEKGSEPLGLETLLATAGAVSGQMHFWNSLDSDWKGENFSSQDGELRLSAPAGGTARAGHPLPASLNDGGRCLVTFTARADQAFTGGLRISMESGEDGGITGYPVNLEVEDFSTDPRTYQEVLDLLSSNYLYFTTSSTAAVYIQDVNIICLDGIALPLFENRLFTAGEEPAAGEQVPLYQPFYQDDAVAVYRNLNCLPRAYAVRELQAVADLAEMKERSFTRQYDPSVTAQVLAEELERIDATSFAAGDVATTETSGDYLAFDVEMEGDGFVVGTDQYYAGWTAAVDGEETTIYEVNGFMRGVKVPAGSHRLEFRYAAPGLRFSLWLCLACFLLVLAALAWLAFTAGGRRFDTRLSSAPPGESREPEAGGKALRAEEFFVEEEKEEVRQARVRARRKKRDV